MSLLIDDEPAGTVRPQHLRCNLAGDVLGLPFGLPFLLPDGRSCRSGPSERTIAQRRNLAGSLGGAVRLELHRADHHRVSCEDLSSR